MIYSLGDIAGKAKFVHTRYKYNVKIYSVASVTARLCKYFFNCKILCYTMRDYSPYIRFTKRKYTVV